MASAEVRAVLNIGVSLQSKTKKADMIAILNGWFEHGGGKAKKQKADK